ncbi:methyltransferase domain-containing protein [Nocardioides islandensis]|uniref:Methyltransferase domain-containing protein n=1 Tax=Nocardioides islandensis TaxID=433663 RepID=A0A930VEZ5_9ACTN|nr:methyltransferase domain-containing protein [Nocardioides islandensis]MBF4762745.1 methyltransferase domain-containing protein [Nocardioides islandensis]
MATLTSEQVRGLDPYAFLAVLGKRVIHPGGRASTDRLLELAAVRPGERVLDIGCGVGTTAIRLAREYGAQVVAADIAPLMRERATANVSAAGAADRVSVEDADIRSLPYPDAHFDAVIAEAVTMFVGRRRAAAELARVTRPGGRVLATEFCWREPPTKEAKEVFLGQVCPGMRFDTIEEWTGIYGGAGLVDIETESGPFEMMTARGFLADERGHAPAVMARAISRPAYVRKMAWLMPRMSRAIPFLGYVLVSARKPAAAGVEGP